MSKIPQNEFAFLKSGNSDLLNRLSNFLPEIAAANEKLGNGTDDSNKECVQIDTTLQKDDEDSDSDDAGANTDEGDTKQTIQMTVALGELKDNPIMSLLANDDDNEEGSDDEDSQNSSTDNDKSTSEDSKIKDREGLVLSMLESSCKSDVELKKKEEPLFTVRSTRRRNEDEAI